MEENNLNILKNGSASLAGFFSELMTEDELVEFLRIPEITSSNNLHNVVEHLKRFRNLPRIHICNKALYPKKAVLEWIEKETSG